jgi:hypothetical protein
MPLMPAFRRRKTSAAIVGRLLAGYGELEFLLAFCVGAADAARIAPKPGQQAGAHRWYHERQAIQDMFRERGESKRFNRAKKRMNKEFAGAGLKGHYIETMDAMHQCLKIRNLFAHCHWTQSRKRDLFFINLEDAAVTTGPLRLDLFRHADPKTLARLEDYFWYTFECLDYLAKALAVRTNVMRGPAPSRPKRKPPLPKHDILFPLKSFH